MRFFFIILLLFGFTFPANSQDTLRHTTFSIAPMGGIILPHYPNMQYLVVGHIPGAEIELAYTTDGSKPWHHAYNFPSWGLSLNAYNLRSPHLGYAGAVRAFYDLPLSRNRILGLKMGLGIGYIEKVFNLDDNFYNSAIGSHFNVALGLNFYGRIKLSQKWILKPGIGIHHFSNGAMTLPNTGINLGMLKLLFTYSATGFETPQRLEKPFTKSKFDWFVGSSFGFKQIPPIGSKRYGVANAFTTVQKRINHKSTFGAELGLNYNASLMHRELGDDQPEGTPADNYRAYIAAAYQLNFDPLAVRFQVGSYLFPRFKTDGMVFFRYHIVYSFEKWQAFIGLKSHFAKADNGEIGIAYKLK